MLALDDPRWAELCFGLGRPGLDLPPFLRTLQADPEDEHAWETLWGLHHEGHEFSAVFATLPHLIQQALALPVEEQFRHWQFVAATAVPDSVDPPYLQLGYQAARASARAAILSNLLEQQCSRLATEAQLSALLTLNGQPDLQEALQSLAHGELELVCPNCGQCLLARPSSDPKRGLDLREADF